MSFQVVGAKSKDGNFQNLCWGGIMKVSNDVLASVPGSGSIQSQAGFDLTGPQSKEMAKRFTRKTANVPLDTIATQVLLNSVIASNPDAADIDNSVEFQLIQVWQVFVEIENIPDAA